MTRRCSHCSNNGHNSRTCPAGRAGGVRLFGVRLTEGAGAMKKSASMGCLPSSSSSAAGAGASASGDPLGDHHHHHHDVASGYASDDPARASSSSSCRSERKKGVPWTEDEHRMFLMGLQKLGKGDWRGISRNFVVSRTPAQVASHAQKYFIRQSNASRRKRRSSLFDMVPDMPIDQVPPASEEQFLPPSPPNELESADQLPTLHDLGQEDTENAPELRETMPYNKNPVPVLPAFYPTLLPVPALFWPLNLATAESHSVIRPTPVVPKETVKADEVVGMSKLSIGEGLASRLEPSALSLELLGSSGSRQSAFHINTASALPDLNQSSSSPIHAV